MDTKFDLESLEEIVARAVREDVGDGDVTSEWTLAPGSFARARFEARQPGIVSGLFPACLTFRQVDPDLEFQALLADGDRVESGEAIAEARGAARSLLTGERTALNFMRHLSGIASMTRQYVDAVRNTGARIVDTRKTTPGLRELEKRAVLHGSGANHRHGLFDMVLIKDNHIAAAGGHRRRGGLVQIEHGAFGTAVRHRGGDQQPGPGRRGRAQRGGLDHAGQHGR